jgi:hypothetical protein
MGSEGPEDFDTIGQWTVANPGPEDFDECERSSRSALAFSAMGSEGPEDFDWKEA